MPNTSWHASTDRNRNNSATVRNQTINPYLNRIKPIIKAKRQAQLKTRNLSNAYCNTEEDDRRRRNTPSTLPVEADQGDVYKEPFSLPKIQSDSALGRTMTQEVQKQSGSKNFPSTTDLSNKQRASMNLIE